MGWFSFLILGIIAGVIAKLILRQKAGWFLTIILGVLGAMVGGWIAGLIPGIGYENFWSIQSWLIAIAASAPIATGRARPASLPKRLPRRVEGRDRVIIGEGTPLEVAQRVFAVRSQCGVPMM